LKIKSISKQNSTSLPCPPITSYYEDSNSKFVESPTWI